MASLVSRAAIAAVVFFAVLYQFIFKELLFQSLGYGRRVQSIKDYSKYKCERLQIENLESCEDMFFHEETGSLYMACSRVTSRIQWTPA